MTKSIKQQLLQARRDQILDAAIDVISEKGFQKTTIRQIARAAGVADGTLYNYFKNKEDILLAIIGRLTEAEVRDMQFAEAEQTDIEAFIASYFTDRAQEVEENLAPIRIVFAETMVNPALAKLAYDKIYGPAFAVAEAYFQQMMADGRLPQGDPAVMSRLVAAPMMGLLTLRLLGDQHVTDHWQTYVEAMIRSFH